MRLRLEKQYLYCFLLIKKKYICKDQVKYKFILLCHVWVPERINEMRKKKVNEKKYKCFLHLEVIEKNEKKNY